MKRPNPSILAGAAVVALGGVAVGMAATPSDTVEPPPIVATGTVADSVTINVCASDDLGYVRVSGSVLNPTPARSDYQVGITIRDADDVLLGRQDVQVLGVEPGKAAGWSAATTIAWSDDVRCDATVGATGRTAVN